MSICVVCFSAHRAVCSLRSWWSPMTSWKPMERTLRYCS